MKHKTLTFLSALLMSMVTSVASAYRFEVDGIYYLITSSTDLTVAVTDRDGSFYKYSGNINIPETVSYNGKAYSVTSIGKNAFSGCSGLTSVTIPNSVKSIGREAFEYCRGLVKAEFASIESLCKMSFSNSSSNPLYYAHHLYIGGEEVTDLVIPNSVTPIGYYAFYGCSGLTSVTIPNSVTSIGSYAFYGCSGLTSVTIPNSVTSIDNCALYGVNRVYVDRGTGALLQVWESGYTTPYETGTDKELPAPYISVESTTQTTATIIIHNYYKEYVYDYDGNEFTGDSYIVTGLRPEYTGDLLILVKNDKVAYRTSSVKYTTKSISPSVSIGNRTASSITVIGSYIEGDAEITSHTLTLNGVKTEGNKNIITGTGLEPNRQYVAQYTIKVNGGTYTSKSINITTDALTLTTEQPKVISDGNVIVGATSNLDDAETNIGFEWRRVDWTNDFASNSGKAYLYGGVMEGYIRNLNSNYLWKYRPYYESDSGNRYYGEWVGIDPTNTSYFEPTVHTYARISVDGNRATVSGYAQRGTDNVVSQGFMYWKSVAEVRGEAMYAPSVPKDAMKVEATGTVMEAELDGLEYETDYSYVAYMTTAEGETFYGETKSFRTGEDTTGIGGIESTGPTTGSEPAIYDLNGRKLARMQKGINILRYSDGSVKKVMMK